MQSTTLKLKFEGLDPRLSFYLTELGGGALPSSSPGIEDQWLYPASWVKLFWALQAVLTMSSARPEALIEPMLVSSSDQAGQELVDLLVGVDSDDYAETRARREGLSHFWQGRGFGGIRLAHKTFLGEYSAFDDRLKGDLAGENRVTFAQIHRLWNFILLGAELKPEQRALILKALTRRAQGIRELPDTLGFQASLLGFAFPLGFRFLAKAGWRETLVCDSACFQLKTGKRLLVSIQALCSSEAASIEAIRDFSFRLFGQLTEQGLIENISH